MAAIQRHGELRLHARLTEAYENSTKPASRPLVDELLQAGKTSWEEYRLEHPNMAEEQRAASPELKKSPASDSTKVSNEPESKRCCNSIGLRNATKMIKVEVGGEKEGPPKAEWLIHETLLLANSGLVKSCMAHDTTETSTGTIKMEEADAEAFGVFADFLYKERLDSSKLDINQLITCYILADYVACPKFADLIFQQIHIRTHNSTFRYSARQVDYILSNTLAVQPLRTLLLDEFGRGVLTGKYNFTGNTTKDAEKLLEPHMVDLLGAVMQAIKSTNVAVTSKPNQNIYPDIKHYLKHDIAGVEVHASQPQSVSVEAWKNAEAEIGHQALDYLVRETGVSRAIAFQTLKANDFRLAQAAKAIKRVFPQ